MKAVAPIRQAMGVRTVFNILGPLTNPAAPQFQLTGAFNLPTAQLMADALSGLPIERAFVVHGAEGWDEPTPLGPFTVLDVRPGKVSAEIRSPSDYGLDLCGARDLAGGDSATNARALKAVLCGEENGAHRDALLLGTALALEIVGKVSSPRDGVALARQAIDSGAARRTLDSLAAFGSRGAA
jgi:anthranilate phosphoribosyltransferase